MGLPLLPLYVSYFAGGNDAAAEEKATGHTLIRAIFFVAGFAVVFCLLGLFAGAVGSLFTGHAKIIHIVCGCVVILFGLGYLNVIRLPFKGAKKAIQVKNVWTALIFGMIYSISLTPCVGAFLGAALMMAANAGTAAAGLLLLLCYSCGLGIPFVIAAILIDRLERVFATVKRHYRIINLVCGIFLIVLGALMACGLLNRLMGLLV